MPKSQQATKIDLAKLFSAVASSLGDQRESLNQADSYNQNHGDNMVEIFNTIINAVQEKQKERPSAQLAYASQLLGNQPGGSAQVYANGLSQASKQFQGQDITTDNAAVLLQSLLGGGASSSAPQAGGADLLGTLISSMAGKPAGQQNADEGIDIGDLLNAGLSFMNAKQQGSSNVEAAINALLSASPLGQSSHRTESGALVANTIMQVISSLSKK